MEIRNNHIRLLLLLIFSVGAFSSAKGDVWPISGLTSPDPVMLPYGPNLYEYQFLDHRAMDIICSWGSFVYCTSGGGGTSNVNFVGTDPNFPDYGTFMLVSHYVSQHNPAFFRTAYRHLSQTYYSQGAEVYEGLHIADSGTSGHPHNGAQHLEYWYSDGNPMGTLPILNNTYPHISNVTPYYGGGNLLSVWWSSSVPYDELDFNEARLFCWAYINFQWQRYLFDVNINHHLNCAHYNNLRPSGWQQDLATLTLEPTSYTPYQDQLINWHLDFTQPGYHPHGPDADQQFGMIFQDISRSCDILQDWDCKWGNIGGSPAVYIDDFEAGLQENGVVVSWFLNVNFDISGINIWRCESGGGQYQKITRQPIPAVGRGKYVFLDSNVERRHNYSYKLQLILENGSEIMLDYPVASTGALQLPPERTGLTAVYPNPFNDNAIITFGVQGQSACYLSIDIFDIQGRKVRTIAEGDFEPGTYNVLFDRKDDRHNSLTSGVYFVSFSYGDKTETRKITLLK
jgi:hypothetical protein